MSITDLKGNLIHSFTIHKKSSLAHHQSYLRNSNVKRVVDTQNVWDAIENVGIPFVTVHPGDSGKVVLRLGTHTEIKEGTAVPIVTALGSATALISGAARLSTIIFDKSGGVERYFYMKGNVSTGFNYASLSGLRSQRIDAYELFKKDSPVDYLYKGYLASGKNAFGIYQRANEPEKLIVVKF